MKEFEYKNLLQRKKMTLAELKKYYLEQRKYIIDHNIPEKGIGVKKVIHPLPYAFVALDRMLSNKKLTILNDKSTKTDSPIIYASAHCHPEDPAVALEAIKKHAYLFLGDPEDVYQKIEGLLLKLNGVIYLETRAKDEYINELLELGLLQPEEVEEFRNILKGDRKIAYTKAIEILRKKANLLIFPEGAVNITPNLPVMGLYQGAVKMALETGAEIVPMALERYGNRLYANIGENIKLVDRGPDTIKYYNQKLRDALATLKWEIWEYQGTKTKDECPTEEEFIDGIMGTSDFIYSKEDIYETMYRDKSIVTEEEVFAPILKLNRVR